MTQATAEKPGYRTTEFWVAVLTPLLVFTCQKLGIELTEQTITALIAAIVPYIVGRSAVKAITVRRNGK